MTSIPWLEEVAPPALRYQSLTPLKGPAAHISHAWWNVEMRSSTPGFGMSRPQNDRVTCIHVLLLPKDQKDESKRLPYMMLHYVTMITISV